MRTDPVPTSSSSTPQARTSGGSRAGQDTAAAWSPDGREIVFTSDRDGHEQVYVMRADGTRQRNVSHSRFADTATSWR